MNEKNQIILLVDMDAFFAQIEERQNPRFSGKPLVVGADPKHGEGRGVVSTSNYEARKFGIRSGLPISKAWQLCPTAVFLPVNFELYERVSAEIMAIIKKYSAQCEVVSIDEAYLDISFLESYERAENLAGKLKKEILDREKLTCTIGIGPNKVIAKMAAEKAKPNGLRAIKPKEVERFLASLNVEDLPGIGPKTAAKLRDLGIRKIAELRKSSDLLRAHFGKWGKLMHQRSLGRDIQGVESSREIKSISKEQTFLKDTREPEILLKVFENICKEVFKETVANSFSFKTITVICRFSGFETHTKAKTLNKSCRNYKIFKSEATKLFLRFFLGNFKPIRLVGVRVSGFKKI